MRIPFILVALALALGAPASLAQAPAKDAKDAADSAPVYTPPQRGAPQRRVGGSSRGVESALPRVILLVPDHVGLTASENPPLYWYLSKPTTVRVEVTLIDDKGETPLVEYAVTAAKGPAVHRIDLDTANQGDHFPQALFDLSRASAVLSNVFVEVALDHRCD